MNVPSPKVVTAAIVLQDCHPGPNRSEDAMSLRARANYRNTPFVKQQREPEQALHFLPLPVGR